MEYEAGKLLVVLFACEMNNVRFVHAFDSQHGRQSQGKIQYKNPTFSGISTNSVHLL